MKKIKIYVKEDIFSLYFVVHENFNKTKEMEETIKND